ncbi:MAG: radical SAM/SPASM domain-containing protein [Thermodesulfobacteriota bacterium]
MSEAPGWNILQLDVSTHCSLRCPTCPRTAFASHWRNAHVPMEVVERLLPHAGRFKLVHLQGWGEPLLHPELPEIVRKFRKTGALCGLTTNGCHLTQSLGGRLVEAGLTSLTVSVSGATEETQALLRPPSSLKEILANTRRFKVRAGESCQVRLSFLRQPENQRELSAAVRICRELELDGMLAVNPTYLPAPEHEARLVSPGGATSWAEWKARLAAVWHRQDLTVSDVARGRMPSCLNRPRENLTVAVDGGVSPCVFLQMPFTSVPEGFEGNLACFGNVLESGLAEIWDRPGYREFRACFARREEMCGGLVRGAMEDMDNGGSLKEFREALERMEREHPLPVACSGCLKAEGL